MEFLIPKDNTTFYLINDFKEVQNGLVLKIIHSKPKALVYWYLNDEFIGQTEHIHEITITPKEGSYIITAIDDSGEEIRSRIKINI